MGFKISFKLENTLSLMILNKFKVSLFSNISFHAVCIITVCECKVVKLKQVHD